MVIADAQHGYIICDAWAANGTADCSCCHWSVRIKSIDARRLLMIALFGLWVWAALWLNWHVVLLATTAIVLIETI